jgi:uncharacterized membrane protein YcaP (DUF421 family)
VPDVEWLDRLLGLSLKSEELGFGHMAARAAVMYVAMIAIVRLGKKRALGGATAFDVILIIILGSVAARAMTGGAPFFPSLLAMIVMVVMHWAMSAIARDAPSFSHWVKGHSTVLIRDGELQSKALRDQHVSSDDLAEDLRQKGVCDPSEVQEARLERNGKVSVIKK